MKRNMDLIRDVLIYIEEDKDLHDLVDIYGIDNKILSEHFKLMIEADLVRGQVINENVEPSFVYWGLTWKGYDSLEIRKTSVWEKIKFALNDVGTSVPFNIMKEMGEDHLREYVGLW